MSTDTALVRPAAQAARVGADPIRRQQLLTLLLAVAALAFPYVNGNDANIDAVANAFAFAALALGLNIVVGMAGLLDLGYAAFFAIGAYTYGVAASWQLEPAWTPFWEPFEWLGLVEHYQRGDVDAVHFTVSFWLMMPISAAIAAFFGVAFGAPTLRLRGDYLAIVTLGFGEIVPIVVRNMPEVTNGAMGLNGVRAPSLFGYDFGVDAVPYYYVGLGLVAALIFTSMRLRESRVGRAWMAIREDEIAASAMGVDLVRNKLLAFGIGAAFAGAVGTFYVAKLQTATPDMFGFPVSVMVLVMVVLGGLGSIWGVVLGAAILQLLQSWFLQDISTWLQALGEFVDVRWLAEIQLASSIELIFGILLVTMMLWRRDGLIPARRRTAPLTLAQQAAQPARGGFAALASLGAHERPKGAPCLEVRGVEVRFGGLVALKSVDLTVPTGGLVAVIGPNGSGKSTLFNVITGLNSSTAGSVALDGERISGLPPHRILRKGIARTFQNLRLFPELTVLENVLIGQHARLQSGVVGSVLRLPATRREEAQAREWALEILSIFGNRLLPRVDQTVSGLSYANRRRVEIARALASRPKLLMLDEPTAGMNPAESLELGDQIGSLKQLGLSILLIEHKLDVIAELADTVIVLDHGEKLAEGTAAQVRNDEAVILAYLGRAALAPAVP